MFETDTDTLAQLMEYLGLPSEQTTPAADQLKEGESRFLKDLKVNVKNALKTDHLSDKETALIGLSLAANDRNEKLRTVFTQMAEEAEATKEEIAEAVACASLLASNNVTYRFRHFMNMDKYNNAPMRIKMNIMMKPVTGKEFFELMSLAVSAVNGCEMCVVAHEKSLVDLGSSADRVWDTVRLSGVVTSLAKIVY